ncbi:MAG: hypothetical protein V7711_14735, partial [Pseudomonadales bacterium]
MPGILSELKRRNVFRVAIAYLALAWLVIQITDMAVPALHLPESLNGIVFYLGLIGFPFACLFAWAFELTPDGLKKSADVTPEDSVSDNTARKIEHVVVGLLVLAVAFLAFDKLSTSAPQSTNPTVSEIHAETPPKIEKTSAGQA